jgi:ketosteroid isomerase-like protein
MKTNVLLTLVAFSFIAYAAQAFSQMTAQEQETVKIEVGGVVNVIFRSLEKMDADALFQSYSDSPDFVLFTTDGSIANFQQARNHHFGWFKSLSSIKVTSFREAYRLLPGNIVLCAWLGKFEMTPVKGGQMTVSFAITFAFRKIDGAWKVVYQQTAALPPAPQEPQK